MGIKVKPFYLGGSFAAAVTALSLGLSGGASAASLEDAVQAAVRTNPEVIEVATDRRAVDQERRQAFGLFLPSLDFSAQTGLERTLSSSTGGKHSNKWRNQATMTLTQLLFDGFASYSELQRQRARVGSAAERVRETAEFVGLNAIEAYLEVLRQQELVKLSEELVGIHETTLSQMQRRAASGRGRAADVQQAAARLGLARATLSATRGALRDGQANYIRVVGDTPDGLSKPAAPSAAMPANLTEALNEAATGSPTIRIAKADVEVAQAEAKAADAPLYPRIDLRLSGTRARNLDGVRGNNDQASGLIVVQYNLYRGGIDAAARREALERASEARAVLAKTQRRVQEDVRLSWNAVQTARERLESLREHATRTEQVRNAYRQQFDIAARTLLDVLDAENELFNARSAVITAEYTELFGMYRLLASMGKLLGTLLVEVPAEAIR